MNAPEVIYQDSVTVYDKLVELSEDGRFEGSKVEAFRATKVNPNKYTPVFRYLNDSGCITQVQTGNVSQPTILVLNHPPDEAVVPEPITKLTRRVTLAKLIQDVETLQRRIPDADLLDLITSFDARLTDLEATVSKMQDQLDFLLPREEE